jgi:hypothetical protein
MGPTAAKGQNAKYSQRLNVFHFADNGYYSAVLLHVPGPTLERMAIFALDRAETSIKGIRGVTVKIDDWTSNLFGFDAKKLDPEQLLLAIEDVEQAVAGSEAAEDKKDPASACKRADRRPSFDSYGWKCGLEENLIAFLHARREREHDRISGDPTLQGAFLSLLACVVSRGGHIQTGSTLARSISRVGSRSAVSGGWRPLAPHSLVPSKTARGAGSWFIRSPGSATSPLTRTGRQSKPSARAARLKHDIPGGFRD